MINFLLAQATQGLPFWQVAEHGLVVVSIIAAVAAIAVARRKREDVRLTGQPLRTTVEGEVDVRTKGRRWNAVEWEGKHDALHDHICAVDQYAHTEVDRIHDKLDIVDRRHADNLRDALQEINKTVNDLPERVITLLHKTGQLRDHNK